MHQGRIHVNKTIDILYRLRAGHSQRQVNRETGVSRQAIRKYCRLAMENGWLSEGVPLPDIDTVNNALKAKDSKRIRQYSTPVLKPYEQIILNWLKAKYTRKRILTLLRENYEVDVSYESLKKYCRRLLSNPADVAKVRLETLPGEIAQLDFGEVTRSYRNLGEGKRVWVFIMTLGYSRHIYVEHVFDQTTETWLRCHENAFRFFGGVVDKVVIDNLKAAVKKILFYDPVLSEPYKRLARHYGFIVSPCRPYTPEHKGKVESNVSYVRRSICDCAVWTNLAEMNARARKWSLNEAGERIHGTIYQKPVKVFREIEQKTLKTLPARPLEYTTASRQKLPEDIHINMGKNWYSAPYQYIGQYLDIYAQGNLVKIYSNSELIATHSRSRDTGKRITNLSHYPRKKRWWLENTGDVCLERAGRIGESCREVTQILLSDKVQDRLQSVHRLLALRDTYTPERLENACARAIHYGDCSYSRVKTTLASGMDAEPLEKDEYIPVKKSGYDNAAGIGGVV